MRSTVRPNQLPAVGFDVIVNVSVKHLNTIYEAFTAKVHTMNALINPSSSNPRIEKAPERERQSDAAGPFDPMSGTEHAHENVNRLTQSRCLSQCLQMY